MLGSYWPQEAFADHKAQFHRRCSEFEADARLGQARERIARSEKNVGEEGGRSGQYRRRKHPSCQVSGPRQNLFGKMFYEAHDRIVTASPAHLLIGIKASLRWIKRTDYRSSMIWPWHFPIFVNSRPISSARVS